MQPKSLLTILAWGLFLVACNPPSAPGPADAQPESPVTSTAQEAQDAHRNQDGHGDHDSHDGHDGDDGDDGHDSHDGHHAHHAHAAAPEIDPGHVRWATDAPLRDGMRRMHDAIAGVASTHPDRARALVVAAEVDQAAAYMFANCKLEAEPDVALHGLLARLMAGAQALRQDPDDAAALLPMRAALVDYARLFDDPTFPNPTTNGDGGS